MIKKIKEVLVGLVIIAAFCAVFYGAFLLNTYRWGSCS